ncbi:MAG: lamin tail domain-containing protein, partial [Thermoplasmata archaeon]
LDAGGFNVKIEVEQSSETVRETTSSQHVDIYHYENLNSKGSRYPRTVWDTLGCIGNYSITFTVDSKNQQSEGNELDNFISLEIQIIPTSPASSQRRVLINEIYYDPITSGEPEEYIALYNPTELHMNISKWLLEDGEGIVRFPEDTFISPGDTVIITQDAGEFEIVFGYLPDFEISDCLETVPDMEIPDYGFKLTNTGDEIMLRTKQRHQIDTVAYGNSDFNGTGWHGPPVPPVSEGMVLKRNFKNTITGLHSINIDTNTSFDWQSFRKTVPGQSDFSIQTFEDFCNVSAFITPDCSLDALLPLLRTANSSIDIATYIFTNEQIKNELVVALNRKVTVRMLLSGELGNNPEGDGLDMDTIPEQEWQLVSELYAHGARIQFMASQPEAVVMSRYSKINIKYIIVDNKAVLITTENFGNKGFPNRPGYGNRGFGVIIEHPELALYLTEIFEYDWNKSRRDSISFDPQRPVFKDVGSHHPFESNDEYSSTTVQEDNSESNGYLYDPQFDQITVNEYTKIIPVIGPDNIFLKSSVLELIGSAKTSLSITLFHCDLYWLSDSANYNGLNPFLEAVITAAQNGVGVKLLLDPHGFSPDLLYNNSSTSNNDYSDNGNLHILKYINQFSDNWDLEARLAYLTGLDYLHGNIIIVDSESVLLSSFHWGLSELSSNRELGVIVNNPSIAGYFQEAFTFDWELAPRIYQPADNQLNSIIITEIYYDTYLTSEPEEYFALYNPTEGQIDLGGWFISDGEGTLWFPNHIILEPEGLIYITRSAYEFYSTFNFWPDFEFINNSDPTIQNIMIVGGLFQLSNSGDEIILMDRSGKIIDVVIYGSSGYCGVNWNGVPVPDVSEGRILKRNFDDNSGIFIDTDTKDDWQNLREYYPGQSQFALKTFTLTNVNASKPTLCTFVSPDSSYDCIYRELCSVKKSVYINVYQFEHEKFANLLIELAENGMDVRVLLEGDPVGGLSNSGRELAYKMKLAGCSVRLMITDPSRDIFDRYAVNHGKYAVLDDCTVIVMSENWKETGIPADPTSGNRGTGVIIHDKDTAQYFTSLFMEDSAIVHKDIMEFDSNDPKYGWEVGKVTSNQFEDNFSKLQPAGDYQPRFPAQEFFGRIEITPVISPDHSLLESGSILEMLGSAKESILIEQLQFYRFWNSYTGASQSNLYLEEILDAARRGCDVNILLDSAYIDHSDNVNDNAQVVKYINTLAIEEGLESNLKARLINLDDRTGRNQLVKVHNKGIIVDGQTVYVGSMNWGFGGPIKNREVGVIISHTGVAKYFKSVFWFDWNLTLNNKIETALPYSTSLRFTKTDVTLNCGLAIFNTNRTDSISIDLTLNVYKTGNGHNNFDLLAILNRTRLQLNPESCETLEITITLVEKTSEIIDSSQTMEDLWVSDNNIIFMLELRSAALNMTTTSLWLEILYRENPYANWSSNTTSGIKSEPWTYRDLEAWKVLAIVILTMITISVVRDMVGRRNK